MLQHLTCFCVILKHLQVQYWDSRLGVEPLTRSRKFVAASCVVVVNPRVDFNGTIRCLSVAGFGYANVWQVRDNIRAYVCCDGAPERYLPAVQSTFLVVFVVPPLSPLPLHTSSQCLLKSVCRIS